VSYKDSELIRGFYSTRPIGEYLFCGRIDTILKHARQSHLFVEVSAAKTTDAKSGIGIGISMKLFARALQSLDYRVFHNFFQSLNKKKTELKASHKLRNNHKLIRTEAFTIRRNSLLNELCDRYGSDKGSYLSQMHPHPWPSHTYTEIYSILFDHCREGIKLVLECGIGTNNESVTSNMTSKGKPGASLRVWRDYFPNANIVGIDIDSSALFEEERIETFQVDQTSKKSINSFLLSKNNESYDLIIDDGLHEFHAAESLFVNLFPVLRKDGIYVIEDVLLKDLQQYISYFGQLEKNVQYYLLHRNNEINEDNFLIVIRK
jgi:hypothetical protein